MPHRLLLVDDDPAIGSALSEALSSFGYEVEVAVHAAGALAAIGRWSPDVVVSDVRMPDMTGLELARLLRERAPEISVVLMTAYDDMPTVVEAMQIGATEFLVKPLDLDDLLRVLERIFADRTLRSVVADRAVATPLGTLVGREPSMIQVYKLLGQAALTNAAVLVRGESGTGKELVARAIHAYSSRHEDPFVPVNCAAIPPTLLESELFGHVRGAFTGATHDRRGRFSLAGRGTIFLDEIGDTTPDFQSKLLRVLQDREYQPVGSDQLLTTEARVVAATHQPLETLIVERRFREDLYFRMRVVEIVLPPLRERVNDIPLLAQHVLDRASAKLGTPPATITPEAMRVLRAHQWPGNVRELEHCLMRAVVVATGRVLRPEHLSLSSPAREDSARLLSLDDVERAHVAHVLRITEGHKGRAADILGVSRPRLARLIEKYGLT